MLTMASTKFDTDVVYDDKEVMDFIIESVTNADSGEGIDKGIHVYHKIKMKFQGITSEQILRCSTLLREKI